MSTNASVPDGSPSVASRTSGWSRSSLPIDRLNRNRTSRAEVVMIFLDTMHVWLKHDQPGHGWMWFNRAFAAAHAPDGPTYDIEYPIPVPPPADDISPVSGVVYQPFVFRPHAPLVRLWAIIDLLSSLLVSRGSNTEQTAIIRQASTPAGVPQDMWDEIVQCSLGLWVEALASPDRVADFLNLGLECQPVIAPPPAQPLTLTRMARHLLRPETVGLLLPDRLAAAIGRPNDPTDDVASAAGDEDARE
uniref:Uncharacterized protein n=1 Tax=Rhizoctonia cerealis phyllomonavirus TaxID=3068671 RepID=A0AA51BSE4_9MONO|nr:MAG: hypothetical protein [Rhizoctonia cerealis phyllomonavirus]